MVHVQGLPTPHLVCHLAFDSQASGGLLLPTAGLAYLLLACSQHIQLLAQVVRRQEL